MTAAAARVVMPSGPARPPARPRAFAPDAPREREAAFAAARVLATGGPPLTTGPHSAGKTADGVGGEPLRRAERSFFEARFGADLGAIRIHTAAAADPIFLQTGATAAALRGDIWLRESAAIDPGWRKRTLAHEIAHVLQPEVARGERLGRTVDDWLTGSPAVRSWGYTQLVSEIDDLEAWLERQTTSSFDETRVREALAELRGEVARRDREARRAARSRPRPAGRDAALPARRPRVLSEPSSYVYSDPSEMRAEYDLIMEWLARRDVSRAERRMLEVERDNLAPQFASDRVRVAGEQRVARLQAALAPSDQEAGRELEVAARVIAGIARDDQDTNRYWIYQGGERLPISADQASQVRGEIDRQLRRASRMIAGDSEQSWDTYQSQLAVNRDHPIISSIAGWLGGANDPGEELSRRRRRLVHELRTYDEEIAAGNIVAASRRLATIERQAQVIHGAAAAFRDRHISGAERAVGALEITRDVSFAIAGSIAAVLAAPVVAGAVAGAGLTGATATVATIGGTGLVVGGGTGIVRGGSAATGVVLAGGSARDAGRAFVGEGGRGFLDGFMAGRAAAPLACWGRLWGLAGRWVDRSPGEWRRRRSSMEHPR